MHQSTDALVSTRHNTENSEQHDESVLGQQPTGRMVGTFLRTVSEHQLTKHRKEKSQCGSAQSADQRDDLVQMRNQKRNSDCKKVIESIPNMPNIVIQLIRFVCTTYMPQPP